LFTYPLGYGIFSDIDDTLRQSHVSDQLKLLQSTFLDPWTPVPGMPELFRHLQTTLATGSTPPTTTYVSVSPWQLIDHLKGFTESYYAVGELMLAPFAFYSPTAFMRMNDPTHYKMDRFEQLHARFPLKRWYLLGDSSQHDPEIYAKIYEKYGDKAVACIWIVMAPDTDGKQNEVGRFEKAFAKVPVERWQAFQDPTALLSLPAGQCRP
jgi:phosphatidate phosphatase APP1